MNFNYTFVDPQKPVGWPIDEVSEYLKDLKFKRRNLNTELFFLISTIPNCQNSNLMGNRFCSSYDNSNTLNWYISSSKSSSEIERQLELFKQSLWGLIQVVTYRFQKSSLKRKKFGKGIFLDFLKLKIV